MAGQPQGTFSICQVKLLTKQKSKGELGLVNFTAEADTTAKYSLKYRNCGFLVVQHMIGICVQVSRYLYISKILEETSICKGNCVVCRGTYTSILI